MSGVRPGGDGRSRRGPSWAQLGRRGAAEQPSGTGPQSDAAPAPVTELRVLAVRPPEPADTRHLGDNLSAYLDGELGHESRERVQAHLATCPDCLAEADEARTVKQLLTRTDTPGPSSLLMARLMAVAALPDDEPGDGPRQGPRQGPGVQMPGTLGGSRLTGGTFGRGAGSSFGSGALGAGTPLPGVDPRAGASAPPRPDHRSHFVPPATGGPGGVLRGLTEPLARRGTLPSRGRPSALPEPAAAAAAPRPASPFGRRFVFAAAGAFSVAAVTLGGVGGPTAGGEEPGTRVGPVSVPGGGAVPVNAQLPAGLPADLPVVPAIASAAPQAVPQPGRTGYDVNPIGPHHLLR